jgi:RNA polymerase sigma-70 factor (ECF subfamily)
MNHATNNRKYKILLEEYGHLIRACINGDRTSQCDLYEHFAPKMFAVCLRYAKNREEAEDIMQEGFLQVFKSLSTFKNIGSFEGWIRKIMMYSAIHHYRSHTRMHSVITVESVENNTIAEEETLTRLQKKELLIMVQSLPPTYRMIFNLYVFEGMKHREIAEHLGISEGTSKSNFFDAKLILRKAVANSLKILKTY